MSGNYIPVGRSADKGFTPQANKNLKPVNLSGLDAYRVVGDDFSKSTIIYFKPEELAAKVAKYKAKRAKLVRLGGVSDSGQTIPEKPKPKVYRGGRPVICLNTGRYFLNSSMAADHYRLSSQMVTSVIKGAIYSAKGRKFRLATADEIASASVDKEWRFSGELLPVMEGKKMKGKKKQALQSNAADPSNA